jgi:DNA-binding NarL/FixJ family response regulator
VSEPIRVVIADDHAPTRAGIRSVLADGGFDVVAEVTDGVSAVAAAHEHRPDVVLLDVNMPGGGGVPAAHEITSQLPGCRVVMLTASRDDSDLFAALRAGAAGYLIKDMDPDRLPNALLGVLNGEAALPRTLVSRVLAEFASAGATTGGRARAGAVSPMAQLTAREREVLELLKQGLTTDQVAKRLFVSPVTVRAYVSTSVKKLRVPDRAAALRLLDSDD